jgi:hypothetical protein
LGGWAAVSVAKAGFALVVAQLKADFALSPAAPPLASQIVPFQSRSILLNVS